ncbi:L-aspartate oxidase [bacterium]|nr:MAG: L-aspartate oxidase [bacterium]
MSSNAVARAVSADVLVVGSGIAGLRVALALSPRLRVFLVTKKHARESNTNYAQGGIASVLDSTDSFESHVRDTISAGGGICRPEIVEYVVQRGPEMIEDLVRQGVHFTELDDGAWSLGREGGHSSRRIVHAGDYTGREIEQGLLGRVRADSAIEVAEDHIAVDLLQEVDGRVAGARVLNRVTRELVDIRAGAVILASGGSGKVYRYTSNPDIATGDGMAMAWRAGATLANLEFVQFHPTSLFHPAARNFLISEAVRGEGAVLRNLRGEAFMEGYHELKDLAPRDVVARSIDREMKGHGETHVLLDTTVFSEEFAARRFPNISSRCAQLGIDIANQPLPVVPAAHYQCGGVVVDRVGRSDIDGLYVIGEAACTGLHGANRLASNSLLEALVLAHGAGADLMQNYRPPDPKAELRPLPASANKTVNPTSLKHDWEVARKTMWDYVGIVRERDRLATALDRISSMAEDARTWCHRYRPDADLVELRNVTLLAELIVRSAIFRQESRGLHTMAEFPDSSENYCGDTMLSPGRDEPWLRPLTRAGERAG